MLKKLLATAALVVATPFAASADSYRVRTTYVPADPSAQRVLVQDSTRAQRAISMRIQRTLSDLTTTEQELRIIQTKLDRTTLAYNRAVISHDNQRAMRLDGRLVSLREQADAAEARRDLNRAHLDVLRADYRRAVDAVYAAEGRGRVYRNGRG